MQETSNSRTTAYDILFLFPFHNNKCFNNLVRGVWVHCQIPAVSALSVLFDVSVDRESWSAGKRETERRGEKNTPSGERLQNYAETGGTASGTVIFVGRGKEDKELTRVILLECIECYPETWVKAHCTVIAVKLNSVWLGGRTQDSLVRPPQKLLLKIAIFPMLVFEVCHRVSIILNVNSCAGSREVWEGPGVWDGPVGIGQNAFVQGIHHGHGRILYAPSLQEKEEERQEETFALQIFGEKMSNLRGLLLRSNTIFFALAVAMISFLLVEPSVNHLFILGLTVHLFPFKWEFVNMNFGPELAMLRWTHTSSTAESL